jgi:hypothetical protein
MLGLIIVGRVFNRDITVNQEEKAFIPEVSENATETSPNPSASSLL